MMATRAVMVGCVFAFAVAACGGGSLAGRNSPPTTADTETAAEAATTTEMTGTTVGQTVTTGAEKTTTTGGQTITTAGETTTTVDRNAASTSPEAVPDNEGGETVTGEVPEEFMVQVFSAAEQKTGASRSEMTVVRAESVIWPDGSLGCAEPGMVYTQATVDGYWVELSVGARMLDFRLSVDGQIRLCEGNGVAPTG